jgi:probable HAF family extracellular repeat protein
MKAPASLAILACILIAASSLCAAQTSYAITDLGTLSSNGYSVARAVNATAEVTGAAGNNNSNVSDIFFYGNGAMTSLGTLGGPSGIGNAINASGQVAGYSQNSSQTYRAFLSSGSTLTDIGDLGGGSAVAFVYSAGKIKDLNGMIPAGSGWALIEAQGIDATGQIVGMGTHNGQEHAYLLTPQ